MVKEKNELVKSVSKYFFNYLTYVDWNTGVQEDREAVLEYLMSLCDANNVCIDEDAWEESWDDEEVFESILESLPIELLNDVNNYIENNYLVSEEEEKYWNSLT